ncbi:helix-turn-helix domain-containing protein [Intestinimonas sp. MSJ-38]|uniref:helix-turn-helix domain-containing protein n=1 Tax=Intestinimonas sp. MSJ-38 TaxID=2841532 RepID=UPI00352FA5BE
MKKEELQERYSMLFSQYPDIINISQLQKMLGISRHLAYDLINQGRLTGIKIGNAFKVPKISVIRYIMEQEANSHDC